MNLIKIIFLNFITSLNLISVDANSQLISAIANGDISICIDAIKNGGNVNQSHPVKNITIAEFAVENLLENIVYANGGMILENNKNIHTNKTKQKMILGLSLLPVVVGGIASYHMDNLTPIAIGIVGNWIIIIGSISYSLIKWTIQKNKVKKTIQPRKKLTEFIIENSNIETKQQIAKMIKQILNPDIEVSSTLTIKDAYAKTRVLLNKALTKDPFNFNNIMQLSISYNTERTYKNFTNIDFEKFIYPIFSKMLKQLDVAL